MEAPVVVELDFAAGGAEVEDVGVEDLDPGAAIVKGVFPLDEPEVGCDSARGCLLEGDEPINPKLKLNPPLATCCCKATVLALGFAELWALIAEVPNKFKVTPPGCPGFDMLPGVVLGIITGTGGVWGFF